MSKTYQYKVVLLGDSAVGKSSLVLRFVRNTFSEHQESTIGAAFLSQTIIVDGDNVKLEIWDTAGQERYQSLAPMYYRGAQAALVVYDITSYSSFERAKNWIKELHKQASPNIVIALIGNKLDLEHNRQVNITEVEGYAREMNLLFWETSAKSGQSVQDVFMGLGKKLPKTEKMTSEARISSSRINIANSGLSGGNDGKSRCCSTN